MIVDAQIHVWQADSTDRPWPRSGAEGRTATAQRTLPLGPKEVLHHMDKAGVDRAVLVPPSWEGDRNDLALDAARSYPNRFAVFGRIAPDISDDALSRWCEQPGMLGIRVILSTNAPWVEGGAAHPLWSKCAAAKIPMMIAPAGKVQLVEEIANAHPKLSIIVDHMGARVHKTGAEAFPDIEQMRQLAHHCNVAMKASGLPAYSNEAAPWNDVMPYLRRLYDAYGAERTFWGSDLSRLPGCYGELVDVFANRLSWLRGTERDRVMGKALLDWIDWPRRL